MADRRPWRPSIATRSALAAGLISAVLFVSAGSWVRHYIYTEQMQAAVEKASTQLDHIVHGSFGQPSAARWPSYGDVTYEVVHSDGRILRSTSDLEPFERDDPVMPVPALRKPFSDGQERRYHVTFPAKPDLRGADLPELSAVLAGRDVTVLGMTGVERAYDGSGINEVRLDDPPEPTIAVYVFATPFDADKTVADVDKVMWPLMPAAVLLVMLVAYVATRAGLRPVEKIRAQTAEITSRALHRRVPVPPTRDAVARLATTLNETLDRLEKSSEQQRRFVADVTHELRSPIASLRAVLEVASEHRDRADWPVVTENAIADVERIQALVDDLLLLAKFDADQPAPVEPLDLGELAKQHVAGRPAYDGVTTTCEAAENLIVDGNARELERLLRNLLDNAERHARTKVHVSVHREVDEAVLDVVDDGPGIPAADRTRVFERFVRLDESRSRDEGGVGLGLAIAHDIATRHHGSITIDDSPSGGTRLSVRIPPLNAERTTSEPGA